MAQNQVVKEQFDLLSTDPRRILEALELVDAGAEAGAAEDEEDFIVEFPKRS